MSFSSLPSSLTCLTHCPAVLPTLTVMFPKTFFKHQWISMGAMFSALKNFIPPRCFIHISMSPSIFIENYSSAIWHAVLKLAGYCCNIQIFTWHHYILFATSHEQKKKALASEWPSYINTNISTAWGNCEKLNDTLQCSSGEKQRNQLVIWVKTLFLTSFCFLTTAMNSVYTMRGSSSQCINVAPS
jgi:hypothetical protein